MWSRKAGHHITVSSSVAALWSAQHTTATHKKMQCDELCSWRGDCMVVITSPTNTSLVLAAVSHFWNYGRSNTSIKAQVGVMYAQVGGKPAALQVQLQEMGSDLSK